VKRVYCGNNCEDLKRELKGETAWWCQGWDVFDEDLKRELKAQKGS